VDLRTLNYPKYLSLLSFSVRNSLKGKVEAIVKPEQLEFIEKWCTESGNKLLDKKLNKVVIQRGNGFHGICFNERITFYLTGIKLHVKEFIFKLLNRQPDYFINFISIREGIEGINLGRRLGFNFEVMPSPKEVEKYCGFALGFYKFEEAEKCFFELLNNRIGVETMFKRNKAGFEIIKKAWEVK